jgi:hypothetical protein
MTKSDKIVQGSATEFVLPLGYYPGVKVGQAFQPDGTGMSGWKA